MDQPERIKFTKYSDEEIRLWIESIRLCPVVSRLLKDYEFQELLDEAKSRGL